MSQMIAFKKAFSLFILISLWLMDAAQEKTVVREYKKVFTTYPFSDPDPIPRQGKIYPYFRFDGYASKPVQKEWKVVELENKYIRLMILPEIGGKIWAAIEKSTGRPFIYYNHVVKFRDIAMRGPWTSGGLEPNYGIIGHTPGCATPVDYTTIVKPDGSVSCVVGLLDLLTRTSWRLDINLPADKAYFTTSSIWYNNTPVEQAYYTWMNAGLPAEKDLQFIYPGTKFLGHSGEYGDWPVNHQNGRDVSWYRNNDFGGPKSYHVFGKYTNFFGAYWHDKDFGMGRYSPHDDKPGKKIWIWGLSDQGMIWEKLLTDTDRQYVEVQSGRMFNQAAEESSFSPFKHIGFAPQATDQWTECWFPVLGTKGLVTASNYAALNVKQKNGWLKIYLSPLQEFNDELKITEGNTVIYSRTIEGKPLRVFADSIRFQGQMDKLAVRLGENKLVFEGSSDAGVLQRPVATPKDFDWNNAYGLYLQGKEDMRQRFFGPAEEKFQSALQKEPYYVPALVDYAILLNRKRNNKEALEKLKTALSVDTYDPAANYYYGLVNEELGNSTDAKDGFDIAALTTEYRAAAYSELAGIYFNEGDLDKALEYARKANTGNRYLIQSLQLQELIYRLQKQIANVKTIQDSLLQMDPLNHFSLFEKYLLDPSASNKKVFLSAITGELPEQTFLELAIFYNNHKRTEEAIKVLELAPTNAEVLYWLAYLQNKPVQISNDKLSGAFPFRYETAKVLEQLMQQSDNWFYKFHLALIEWNLNNIERAKELFMQCRDLPGYAPFYASRALLFWKVNPDQALNDLQKAIQMDPDQWRYGNELVNYYFDHNMDRNALQTATLYYGRFPSSYVLGMQKIKALMKNQQYGQAHVVLDTITILPYEGAMDGRQLYRETELMMAIAAVKKGNYQEALKYINSAKKWPQNLGAGKPYDADIDERMENWMSYKIYSRLHKKREADLELKKILTYSEQLSPDNFSLNSLITALALKEAGKNTQAENLLESWIKNKPQDPLAKWSQDIYRGINNTLDDQFIHSDNARILHQFFLAFTNLQNRKS